MLTDRLLIRRIASELERGFAGSRARDVGRLPDGRTAIVLWRKGVDHLLCLDAFGTPPMVTIESGELPIAEEPGFVRALGHALRGTTLVSVKARRGDRLLRFEFGTRSRFGVSDGYALIVELVPRFGNVVLIKGDTVVAALREFTLAENGTRAIVAGQPYQAPPLRDASAPPRVLAQNYGESASEVAAPFDGDDMPMDDLFVYRRDGALVQPHIVALPLLADAVMTREPSLLDLFVEARTATHKPGNDGSTQRRDALLKRLRQRGRKVADELANIARKREAAQARAALREEGDAIFSTLHELGSDAERDEAKDRATELFARYRKLGASLPHLDEREATLRQTADAVATLEWEAERASAGDLDDVIEAALSLEPRPQREAGAKGKRRKRVPLSYTLPNGARIIVGRNPIENAEVTFKHGRPDDLWFHVQNQPSAHVILQRDEKAGVDDNDVAIAAAIAAWHSKAKTSPKVTVDYTRRKYVRKRPAAAPGLVFYTNPKTVVVTPKAEP